jgi:hypothetical protein
MAVSFGREGMREFEGETVGLAFETALLSSKASEVKVDYSRSPHAVE